MFILPPLMLIMKFDINFLINFVSIVKTEVVERENVFSFTLFTLYLSLQRKLLVK